MCSCVWPSQGGGQLTKQTRGSVVSNALSPLFAQNVCLFRFCLTRLLILHHTTMPGNIFVTGGLGYIGEGVWRGTRARASGVSFLKTTAAVRPRVHGGAPCRRAAKLTRAQLAPERAVRRERGKRPHEGDARERDRRTRSQKKRPSLPPGSHTVLALLDSGYTATIFDNLDNSFEAVFDRMKELAGDKAGKMKFVKVR